MINEHTITLYDEPCLLSKKQGCKYQLKYYERIKNFNSIVSIFLRDGEKLSEMVKNLTHIGLGEKPRMKHKCDNAILGCTRKTSNFILLFKREGKESILYYCQKCLIKNFSLERK